jgi:hypothetical protein
MASRKASRSHRHRPYRERVVDVREPVQRFLIVCEGEQTEPNYFRSFRVPKNIVAVKVQGLGCNTRSLVERTIELMEEDGYDQVWCVFDRDSFSAEDFNAAILLAEQHDIGVAYSNEAFELWYLLHFNFYDTGMTRAEYIVKLSDLLGRGYKKKSRNMYDLLESRQATAIQNARRLLACYAPCRPAEDNPSTTVHLLVEELAKFVR